MYRKVILAIDAGGTSYKHALFDYESLELQGKESFMPISSFGTKEGLLGVFRDIFKDAVSTCESSRFAMDCVAFSVPGPFDCHKGISLMKHKWPALKDVGLVDEFRTFGILPKGLRFSFVHDVHAFLLGEKYYGEANTCDTAAAAVIGTGIGFGMWDGEKFIVDDTGHPLCGIYKYPYKNGTVEDVVSGRGVSSQYLAQTGKNLSAKDIENLARSGDTTASEVYAKMGTVLGEIIAPILAQYSIEALVIGGRLSFAFDLYRKQLEAAINKKEHHVVVYQSGMLEHAAMKGAAAWAKQNYGNLSLQI